MPYTRKWTLEEDQFLRKNYLARKYIDIALVLNRSELAIRLRRISLELKPKLRRVSVNEHFFDVIETPIQAYLLGLITGDGWVGKTGDVHGLHLNVKISDRELVELLRDNLSPEKKIYYTPKQARFSITLSPHFYTVLSDTYGIVPRRKPHYHVPPSISSELVVEFILGYFDADGSLSKTKRGHYVWSLCGGLPFIEQVTGLIMDDLGIEIIPRPHQRTTWLYYLWLYSLERIRAVDSWLHKSGLGLTRKRLV